MDVSTALPSVMHVIYGLGITLLLGFGVKPLLSQAGKSIKLDPPSEATDKQKEQWKELVGGNEGGKYIGWLERFMFFAAFLVNAPLAVATWLAFKVASKWNAWDKLISVPNELAEFGTPLNYLIARRRWGSHLYMTFIFGTGCNIIVGLLGATAARQWCHLFGC